MRKPFRLTVDAGEVVRPVSIGVIAMAVAAVAMASLGWRTAGIAMGALLAVLAGYLVYQVRRAVTDLDARSQSARQAAARAEEHYVEVLRCVIDYTEAKDRYRRGHSENVGRLAGQIAATMGLDDDTCQRLALAGQVHDIGLLAVSDEVLGDYERFGVREFRSLQMHAEASYEVLRPLEMLAEVLPAIRYHHERMNGTGYPAGLTGGDIPLGARILAVADAYDAMTHDRPQRAALSPLAAMRELQRCAPAGYDPECVRALADLLNLPALADAVEPPAKATPAVA